MNKTLDIQDTTACLRQFQSSPEGCTAGDIALAEGIALERCSALLERLHRAAVIQPTEKNGERFTLTENVTALGVLQAVWALQPSVVQVLFGPTPSCVSLTESLSRGFWPCG